MNIRKLIRENVKRRILLEITLKTIEKDIEAAANMKKLNPKIKKRLGKHKASLLKRSKKKMRNKKRKKRVGDAMNNIQSIITTPKKDKPGLTKGKKSASAKKTDANNADTTASNETIEWKQYKKQTAWLYRLNTETNNWETKKVSTDKVFVLGHPDGKTGLKQKKYLTTISLLNKAFVGDLDAAGIDKNKRYVYVEKKASATKAVTTAKTKKTGVTKTPATDVASKPKVKEAKYTNYKTREGGNQKLKKMDRKEWVDWAMTKNLSNANYRHTAWSHFDKLGNGHKVSNIWPQPDISSMLVDENNHVWELLTIKGIDVVNKTKFKPTNAKSYNNSPNPGKTPDEMRS